MNVVQAISAMQHGAILSSPSFSEDVRFIMGKVGRILQYSAFAPDTTLKTVSIEDFHLEFAGSPVTWEVVEAEKPDYILAIRAAERQILDIIHKLNADIGMSVVAIESNTIKAADKTHYNSIKLHVKVEP